ECLAHVDALRSPVSRPNQELSFLATPQSRSSGSKVNPEQADLIQQLSSDSETCTERRRLRVLKWSGLGSMIEPNEQTVDQRQRLMSNPFGFLRTPVRQNASAKITSARKTTDCVLIGSKPAGPEPYIIFSEQ